jgi:hypothetical protein
MFRLLARLFADPTLQSAGTVPDSGTVFATHPIQLSRWLEEIWSGGGVADWPGFGQRAAPLGDAEVIRRLQLPDGLRDDGLRSGLQRRPPGPPVPGFNPPFPPAFEDPPALGVGGTPLPWDHMIYAYLVESTGVVEILGEVVRRYAVGETLHAPGVQTLAWARATEELFFRDPPLFNIGGLTSQLRPDAMVNRRNAYWRMFGWDLPHPWPGGGQPWKRDAGATVNTRFVELWNELLGQVWLAIQNERNQIGANPSDASYIAYLCQTIGEMLRLRRQGGMLAREEFTYVTMQSWFHLTVESDTAVVADLRAVAGGTGNAADRLAAIGARVGITPPRQARELFELADLMSPILWFIELDQFSTPANAALLFRSTGVPNARVAEDMLRLTDLWQSATGHRVKDLAVRVRQAPTSASATQPTVLPAGGVPSGMAAPASVASPASRNGSSPPSQKLIREESWT